MIREEPAAPATTIPLIKDNELRLAKMRKQLEGMFLHLHVAHDEVCVSAEAARSEGLPQVANVLSAAVSNRIFGQLKLLKNIIERLGGTVELPEGEEVIADEAHRGGAA